MSKTPRHRTLLLSVLGICLASLAACKGGVDKFNICQPRPLVHSLRYSVRVSDKQVSSASLIPIGENLALATRHGTLSPVIVINHELSGTTLHLKGEGSAVQNDWMIFDVNDSPLGPYNKIDFNYEFVPGQNLVLVGGSRPSYQARMLDPKCLPKSCQGMIALQIDGDPDLSGYSGSPLAYQAEDGNWYVVGMYVADLSPSLLRWRRIDLGIPIRGDLASAVVNARAHP